jgi:hypothetical protein
VRQIDDEFMFGHSVLVPPMFADQKSRRVDLPSGESYHLRARERLQRKTSIEVANAVGQISLFAKGGILLSLAKPEEHIKPDSFILRVPTHGPSSRWIWAGLIRFCAYQSSPDPGSFSLFGYKCGHPKPARSLLLSVRAASVSLRSASDPQRSDFQSFRYHMVGTLP